MLNRTGVLELSLLEYMLKRPYAEVFYCVDGLL